MPAKVVPGVSDMATTHPELASQLVGADPSTMRANTTSRLTWRCALGHEWEAAGSTRVTGAGCPYCANQRVLAGYNDMATTRPDLAAELSGTDPTTILASTPRKLSWRCAQCGHEWIASADNRFRGRGCPVCGKRAVRAGHNDMATTHPQLAAELVGTDPTTVVAGTNRTLLWSCPRHRQPYPATGAQRVAGSGCGYCGGSRLLAGYNDLATRSPELAAELVGMDPTTVIAGTARRLRWRCAAGHEWVATGDGRASGRGCPYCRNKAVLPGYNDMATTHPHLAAELVGTDPTTVVAGTNRRLTWRCRAHGHEWRATGNKRLSGSGQGCPYCGNQALLAGFNDLATTHPHLAAELVGTDPTTVMAGSERKYQWRCTRGHVWTTSAYARSTGKGCLYCTNQRVLVGFNDLATTHPLLAEELVGTDPTTVIAGTSRMLLWRCPNHAEPYPCPGAGRVGGSGCGYCAGSRVLAGFNDMATTHPHLAVELAGTDPTTITAGTHTRLTWGCPTCGKSWRATGYSRANGSGCPSCAPYGYDPGKPAYLYLMARHGEQQIGITAKLEQRALQHKRYGWELLDSVGPFSGDFAYSVEWQVKAWLRVEIGTLPGTSENWSTAQLEVRSVRELLGLAGVTLMTMSNHREDGS